MLTYASNSLTVTDFTKALLNRHSHHIIGYYRSALFFHIKTGNFRHIET